MAVCHLVRRISRQAALLNIRALFTTLILLGLSFIHNLPEHSRPTNHHTANQSLRQPTNHSHCQPITHTTNKPSCCQPTNHHTANQSLRQPTNHSHGGHGTNSFLHSSEIDFVCTDVKQLDFFFHVLLLCIAHNVLVMLTQEFQCLCCMLLYCCE